MSDIATQSELRQVPTEAFAITVDGGSTIGPLCAALADKFPEADVVARVGMADSGSNTGRLREWYGGPAVGDLQKVLGAVSTNAAGAHFGGEDANRFDETATLETVREKNRAFLEALPQDVDRTVASILLDGVAELAEDVSGRATTGLKGHTYGNLVVLGIARQLTVTEKPDVMEATRLLSEWLGVKAQVVPATNESCNYVMHDRSDPDNPVLIVGEGFIDTHVVADPSKVETWVEAGPMENGRYTGADLDVRLANRQPAPAPTPEAIAAAGSDIRIAGPGSSYTSIDATMRTLPNCDAVLVAPLNLVKEETVPGMTVHEHLRIVAEAAGRVGVDAYVFDEGSLNKDGLPEGVVPLDHDQTLLPRDAMGIAAAMAGKPKERDPNDPVWMVRSPFSTDMDALAHAIRGRVDELVGAGA